MPDNETKPMDLDAAEEKAIAYMKGETEVTETKEPEPVKEPAPVKEAQETTTTKTETQDISTETPKTQTVTSDGVDEQVPEQELIEKGKKVHGLEKSLTQKGQQLADERRELETMRTQLEQQKVNVKQELQTALDEREEARIATVEAKADQEALAELKEIDPVAYERKVRDNSFSDEITSLKKELAATRDWQKSREEKDNIKLQEDLLDEIEKASEEMGVSASAVIGEMYTSPDNLAPKAIAQKIKGNLEKKFEKWLKERENPEDGQKQANGKEKPRPSVSRIAASEGGTPIGTSTEDKPPSLMDDPDAFDAFAIGRMRDVAARRRQL